MYVFTPFIYTKLHFRSWETAFAELLRKKPKLTLLLHSTLPRPRPLHGYHCWFWMTGLNLVISLLNPVITFDYFRLLIGQQGYTVSHSAWWNVLYFKNNAGVQRGKKILCTWHTNKHVGVGSILESVITLVLICLTEIGSSFIFG